jgi:cbb3-type cytochrome oxidase maturation protein
MLIIVLLITISLTIAIGFLVVFIWNLKSGQYEDTYTPSVRMLFDNQPSKPSTKDVSLENNTNPPHSK